jgi:energy-coupling factor transporter ATP-binding protein EcfA2
LADRVAPERGAASPGPAEPIVDIAGLWFWYEGGPPVLRGPDLQVPQGQLLALVGANGSGKTTLVKHLNGLLRARQGRVWVAGLDVARHPVGEMARQVGFLFQHPEQQIFAATVEGELAFGPRNLGLLATEVQERVAAALARFELEPAAERPPAILGYGLRRKVTLASLAAMDPRLLVLDEPTVGLDAQGRREMLDWVAELHGGGRTIVVVTHDMALVARCAQRMVVLHQGQIIGDGPPGALFQDEELLARASLAPPPVAALAQALRAHGFRGEGLTVEAFCDEYAAQAGRSHERAL